MLLADSILGLLWVFVRGVTWFHAHSFSCRHDRPTLAEKIQQDVTKKNRTKGFDGGRLMTPVYGRTETENSRCACRRVFGTLQGSRRLYEELVNLGGKGFAIKLQ
jgi:hypothetical protein